MNQKKLTIITVSLESGGLERIVSNIANIYVSKGWKVDVLTLLNPEGKVFVKLDNRVNHIFFKDIKTHPSSFQKLISVPKWIKFIRQHLQETNPDCILAMTIKIGSMTILANKNKSTRIVVREISDPKSKARNQFMNLICFKICKKADGFIFQTEWEKSCFPKKIQQIGQVIANPVVLTTTASINKRKTIVTMGRLNNFQKRHDVLIKAFSIFAKNHPDYTLEIYGDGPDFEKDQKLIDKLNISEHVFLRHACSDVHEKIRDAECFILTSDYEGLSNALLEAYMMGIPCITSDWPGASEVITNNIDGLIVKRGDISGFAKALSFIVENKETANHFALNAQKNIHKYDAQYIFSQYENIIEGK